MVSVKSDLIDIMNFFEHLLKTDVMDKLKELGDNARFCGYTEPNEILSCLEDKVDEFVHLVT